MASGSSYSTRLLSPVTSTTRTLPARYSSAAVSSRCARYGEGRPSHSPAPNTTATSRAGASAVVRTRASAVVCSQAAGTSATAQATISACTSRR